ncbi:hypothetical protein E8E13_010773 [Curvularia kusanoi]|uniref:Pentatricopeptide repeat protein n=1 Tax=Curvularia kusanoi TaxID=90978 RepID=A0A9P4TM74_CURKU|nr:hypothetical protein E8E13_010773 [Curvularia kusanoi]
MPRARVPGASHSASSDALILPWLAPRALAESPVVRRRHARGGKRNAFQDELQEIGRGGQLGTVEELSLCSQIHSGPRASRLDHTSPFTGASCLRRAEPLTSRTLRYADIASSARRHARSYATNADSSSQKIHPQSPQDADIASNVFSGTRYSRRRSWRQQYSQHVEGLDPLQASRRRARYIARAEERLSRYDKPWWKTEQGHEQLLYNGHYRSLRRLVIALKQHHRTTVDARKQTSMETVDEEWLLNTFAALDRSVYSHVSALTKPVTIEHNPQCSAGTQELLDGVDEDGATRIFSNWHNLKEQHEFYEQNLVYMLDQKSGYAQDFITVLAEERDLPRPKLLVIADALAYLAKLHLKEEYLPGQGWDTVPSVNVRKFISTFLHCTQCFTSHKATAVYSQDLLHSLVQLADTADLKRIYDALRKSHIHLSSGTALHYAAAFGEAGEFRYALQVLKDHLAQYGSSRAEVKDNLVRSERFRWACATILRGSMRAAKNYHETPGIVAVFVEFGVKMDLLLYDVIMHNAMDAGDFATAFKVFNALEGHGLKPDAFTFSILIHGCTTQNDPAKFKAFAEYCLEKAKDLKDPWLAADFLYYTYTCAQNKLIVARDAAPIWRAYLDLFDLAPLEPFIPGGSRTMKDAIDETAPGREHETLVPTPAALFLMLQTEIQTLSTLSAPYVERLYKTFKHAISSKRAHEALTTLARKPIMWNSFLLAFCRKGQYASASSVIKDMDAHGVPANVYSWNIFMKAFFKSGQVAPAERVFELMRARGVDPDAYTHGIMVRGYAKAQLIDRIGETMQHISEDDQLAPDLLRALSQVQNRADLTASLEKNRLAKLQKDVEDADRKAKEEADRLEAPRFKSLFAKAITFKEPTHWDNGGMEDADDFLEPDNEASAVEVNAKGTRLAQSVSVKPAPSDLAMKHTKKYE